MTHCCDGRFQFFALNLAEQCDELRIILGRTDFGKRLRRGGADCFIGIVRGREQRGLRARERAGSDCVDRGDARATRARSDGLGECLV